MINKSNDLPSFVNENNLPKIVDKLSNASNIKITGNKYGNRVQAVIDKIVEKADDVTKAIKQEVVNNSYSFKVGTGDVDVSADVEDGFGEVGVKGVTYQNLWNINKVNGATIEGNTVKVLASANNYKFCGIYLKDSCLKPNTTYTLITNVFENTLDGRFNPCIGHSSSVFKKNAKEFQAKTTGVSMSVLTTTSTFTTENIGIRTIVLNDCTEGFIKYNMLILEGDHTNNPNLPLYFEGIVGVGDRSKNLFIKEFFEWENSNINSDTGKNQDGGYTHIARTNNYMELKKGNYTISWKIIDDKYVEKVLIYDKDTNFIRSIHNSENNTVKSFTVDSDSLIRLTLRDGKSSTGGTNPIPFIDAMEIQLEEGTQPTEYEKGWRGHKIEILSHGKNMYNNHNDISLTYGISKIENGTITTNTLSAYDTFGLVNSLQNINSRIFNKPTRIVKGKKYSISCRVRKVSGEGNLNYFAIFGFKKDQNMYMHTGISYLNLSSINLSQEWFTLNYSNVATDDFDTVCPCFQVPSNVNNLILEIKDIQIEEADTATSYDYFRWDKTHILLDEPLMRLPNGTYDEITRDGKLIRRVGKIVFNGSETWSNTGHGGHSTKNTFEIKLPYTGGLKGANNLCYCNRFPQGITSGVPEEGMYRVVYDGSVNKGIFLLFSPKISEIPYRDTNAWKQWLSKNPTTVYYELAEPIVTELHAPYLRIFKDGHLTFNTLVAPKSSHVIQLNKSAQIERSIRELQGLDNRINVLENNYDNLMLSTMSRLNDLELDYTLK